MDHAAVAATKPVVRLAHVRFEDESELILHPRDQDGKPDPT